MGDSYVESIVPRAKNNLYAALKMICYIAAAICALLGVKIFFFLIGTIILALVGYFVVPNPEIEFEYIYIDRELRIDMIIEKSKRKPVTVLDLDKMEFMCPENSHELDSYRNKNLAKKDYSSLDPEVKPYIMVYKDAKDEKLFRLEPVPEILKAIKTVMPRKVIEY